VVSVHLKFMIFYLFAGLFPGIYRIRVERKNMAHKPKINQAEV
jgi:hypothetical protein